MTSTARFRDDEVNHFFIETEKWITHALEDVRLLRQPEKKSCGAVVIRNVRLYSYTDPARETAPKNSLRSHFSPRILYLRLSHAHKKDIIYFGIKNIIDYPAIEIHLPDKEFAIHLAHALAPLTPDYYPGLTALWRIAIKSFSFLMNLHRILAGEKIFAIFCAEDHTYFGSVYHNHRGYFVSYHCRSIDASLHALGTFKYLFLSLT